MAKKAKKLEKPPVGKRPVILEADARKLKAWLRRKLGLTNLEWFELYRELKKKNIVLSLRTIQ